MRKPSGGTPSAYFLLILIGLASSNVQGQITNTVFFEDFNNAVIDPAKFEADAPFFEGGVGNIAGAVSNGELEFTGTVSQQWWAGATLRVVPTFTVSEEADIIASVDRVRERGIGTASRSAFWIMTADQSKYVLFADVRNEGGWSYNRKIGEAGDVPTGGGNVMAAFDPFDNTAGGDLFRMKVIANGETVRLYLDDVFGAEVRFPYKDLSFHVGSYARANNDTANTVFDNLRVETVGKASFGTSAVTLQQGGSAEGIVVKIPPGANAASDVQIRVVSGNPAVAIPVGAVGGTLTLNFAAGAANEQTIDVQATGAAGGATFTLENDIGMGIGNLLNVTVIEPAGIRLEENFAAATLEPAKWEENPLGFEATGSGVFATDLMTTPGTLGVLHGDLVGGSSFWAGLSIKTVQNFTATQELPLIVEVDRVSIDPIQASTTAARTGVFLTTDDRSRYIFFSQNYGEGGWQVNVNPGNPTGAGTLLPVFGALAEDTGLHRMKIIADGSVAEVFLDGISGGQFAFPISSPLYVELGAYGRAVDDYVSGKFDNVKIQNAVPCIGAAPRTIATAQGVNTSVVTVTIPRLLNATEAVDVTVTSQDPSVAAPAGAVAGALTLNFAAGAANSQSFQVQAIGRGQTTLQFATTASACVDASVAITVTAPIGPVFTDGFATAIDPASWLTSSVALDAAVPGTITNSAVTVVNGEVQMNVTAETGNWPGFALTTVDSYSAQLLSPVGFEVDRVSLGKTLVTGTGAKQRTGVWVLSGTNSLFFGEYATWDGTAGGWQYNRVIGQAGDTPLPAGGVSVAAFNAAQFNNQGNQRIKVVVNGETARLYLNNIFGGEAPFPFGTDIKFGFGTYVGAATDVAVGTFDNAAVLGEVEGAVTDGLVAYWSFDGNFFDSIKDFHGTGRGTAPVAFVDGKAGFGKAIKLNAGRFVEITGGNEDELEFPGGSMSISGWFKVDAFDTEWQALIAKGEGSNYRVARRAATGTIAYAGGVGEGADDVPAVTNGLWHHFVAVTDAAGAEFGTALYLDGVLHGVNTNAAVLTNNANNLLIGANPDTTPNRAWNGEIDDIGIWNRVLSAAEVADAV